jgi:hypothetical protein
VQGRIREFNPLQSPFIQVKAKIVMPGMTNGMPNIKEENKFVIAPSAKKIATYIRNQIFGSNLLVEAENLNINWLMPTLGKALEESVYCKESFIYIHKFKNKVYLEVLRKNQIHDLVQKYDVIESLKIIEDFEDEENNYYLEREIKQNDNGTAILKFKAFEKTKKEKEWTQMPLWKFNQIMGTDYKEVYNLPYHPVINIDIGQEFFKDSEKFINEEMHIFNTFAEEIEKTKTRIVTSQHYQSGDITSSWQPASNMYEVKNIKVNNISDFFTLVPGDEEHQIFEFLQGDIRTQSYIDSFKFCDYQIIQMANLSPASFGYEKDSYQNVASIDLNANLTEMTIESIKRQLEPQINNLIENIVKLQKNQGITENEIPTEFEWDYGSNERFDDMKKIDVLSKILKTASVPYSVRSEIITPILNKLIDTPIEKEKLVEEYQKESKEMKIEFGEI